MMKEINDLLELFDGVEMLEDTLNESVFAEIDRISGIYAEAGRDVLVHRVLATEMKKTETEDMTVQSLQIDSTQMPNIACFYSCVIRRMVTELMYFLAMHHTAMDGEEGQVFLSDQGIAIAHFEVTKALSEAGGLAKAQLMDRNQNQKAHSVVEKHVKEHIKETQGSTH